MNHHVEITCLVDNAAGRSSSLWGEHGLAFLIETQAGRVLFDAGQSGAVLLHNMEALGIDPHTIDALAISHAHYDHTGGLPLLLERTRPGLPLYAHSDLFRERFSLHREKLVSIGLALTQEALAARTTLRLSERPQEIHPGIRTTGEIALRREPEGRSARHTVKAAEGWLPDPYLDDLSLTIEAPAGLVLLCGCCHAGLLNTLAHVERTFEQTVVVIAGGTHLINADTAHLERVGETLRKSVRRVYPNHCSGEEAFHALRLALGADVVRPCPAGTQLDLEV
ncbi:MAG: MBL fold metallo-hydrolase [Anaerolineae bacterium]|nr:MBL fold metallo-hydrolase [Anaerolineae bacterium]